MPQAVEKFLRLIPGEDFGGDEGLRGLPGRHPAGHQTRDLLNSHQPAPLEVPRRGRHVRSGARWRKMPYGLNYTSRSNVARVAAT